MTVDSLRPGARRVRRATLAVFALPLALAACGQPDDPQLAMCQALAKQLTGDGVASWERIEQEDSSRSRSVDIAYGLADGGSGSIDCAFPIDGEGTVATAPDRVSIDGTAVERQALLRAGVQASKEILAGTAAETVARTRALADDAADKAREAAGDAVGAAVEAGKTLQDKLEN